MDVPQPTWTSPNPQIRDQQGTSVNRQVFTQQEHDQNTNLIYFGARYYDPDTARFITQDSYLGESNTPPSLHRYLYAYSNPTVYIDLMGYKSKGAITGQVDPRTDIAIGFPMHEYDSGIAPLDWLNAAGEDFLNLPAGAINSLSYLASSPFLIYSWATGDPLEKVNQDFNGLIMSTGPAAPYIMTGTSPFRAAYFSRYVSAELAGLRNLKVMNKTKSFLTRESFSGLINFSKKTFDSSKVKVEKFTYKIKETFANSRFADDTGSISFATNASRKWKYKEGWDYNRVKKEVANVAQKDRRPLPSEYLQNKFIDKHLQMFKNGASIVMDEDTYRKILSKQYKTLGRKEKFISTTGDVDDIIKEYNKIKDISVIENGFGFVKKSSSKKYYKIDLTKDEIQNLRMPSGRELGANENWRPGGYTYDAAGKRGIPEAVIDPVKVTQELIDRIEEIR